MPNQAQSSHGKGWLPRSGLLLTGQLPPTIGRTSFCSHRQSSSSQVSLKPSWQANQRASNFNAHEIVTLISCLSSSKQSDSKLPLHYSSCRTNLARWSSPAGHQPQSQRSAWASTACPSSFLDYPPNVTSVPTARSTVLSAVSSWSFTKVPLVLPRSVTWTFEPSAEWAGAGPSYTEQMEVNSMKHQAELTHFQLCMAPRDCGHRHNNICWLVPARAQWLTP